MHEQWKDDVPSKMFRGTCVTITNIYITMMMNYQQLRGITDINIVEKPHHK